MIYKLRAQGRGRGDNTQMIKEPDFKDQDVYRFGIQE